MFLSRWLTLRHARGVARGHLDRADRRLRAGDSDGAWKDLLAAEVVAPVAAAPLRQALTEHALAECRAALDAGQPVHVIERAARLRECGVADPGLDRLADAAQEWALAAEQADRGDFALARTTTAHALTRLPGDAAGLRQFAADLDARHAKFRTAVEELHEAAGSSRWRDAVRRADEVIATAPNHREARALRTRAWAAVQPDTRPYLAPPPESDAEADPAPPPTAGPLPRRFLLWVDGVGGYLVCLAPRVTLGQAAADGPVDVPLIADLARLHAELTRDAEGYVLESGRDVLVNGQPAKRVPLADGDRVTLGATCQFVFRRPVPISPTARLDLASGHRLPVAVDGVLLMAESLILGPGERVHVSLPDVPGNVVLYRGKGGLGVRFDGPFAVDGRPCRGRADLPLPASVVGEAFSFAVEPVGPRL